MFTKKKAAVLGTSVLLIVIIGYAAYRYLYQDARIISDEKPEFAVRAAQFASEYSKNIQAADSLYLNKTIEVEGIVTAVENSQVTLDSVVFCGFDTLKNDDLANKRIRVKGRCIGYDELFNEIKLDQCTIVE